MPPYDAILAPTDGSAPARDAVRHAVSLAAASEATLHLLYVVETDGQIHEWDMVVEAAEREGERALDEGASAAESRGVAVEKHLRRGTPHAEILDAVDDYDADVVVMGTHGRSGLQRLRHAGSVAERVVRGSTVPVIALPDA